MKAEELMIGDWVQVPSLIDNVEYYDAWCKVRQLRDWDLDVFGFKNLGYDEIVPIPLTIEIFEKNRFNKTESHIPHCVLYYLGAEELYWDITDSSIGFWAKNIAGNYEWLTVCECKYVHQLQHILRLCNIDKEIVLYDSIY